MRARLIKNASTTQVILKISHFTPCLSLLFRSLREMKTLEQGKCMRDIL